MKGLNSKNVYADCLAWLRFKETNPGIEKELVNAFQTPWIRPALLVRCALSVILLNKDIEAIISLSQTGIAPEKILYHPGFFAAVKHSVFLSLLKSTVVYDRRIERFLTLVRYALLNAVLNRALNLKDSKVLSFACALAVNCFINEYAFFQTAEEVEKVKGLWKEISKKIKTGDPVRLMEIILVAAYRPLYKQEGAHALMKMKVPGDFEALVTLQIREPLDEQGMATQIPSLSSVTNSVSRQVQAQYQENPYPRWIKTVIRDQPVNFYSWVNQKFPFLKLKGERPDPTVSMLMAGCGTGRYAIETAVEFQNAQCMAVDLSRASIAYALRKTKEYGIKNLTFAQADILELKKLERRFDYIESSGVLHHLEDPVNGWRILADILKPNGLMRIGLYSKTARRELAPVRLLIEKRGYSASPEDIRAFRSEILSIASGDSAPSGIVDWNDFYSLSETRDLVFHVQEHEFTIPEITKALAALGLQFLGFDVSPTVTSLYRVRFPRDTRMLDLDAWHQLETENRDIFRGMYQLWVVKPGD